MLIKTLKSITCRRSNDVHILQWLLSQVLVRSTSSVKLLSMIMATFLCHNVAGFSLSRNRTIPAVFALGDSIVNTGNNDYIISITKSNFPPYGRDFMGGKPTGRFSNGRVPSDFIAELYEVKEILPAYLDPNLQLQDLLTGVSFASAGCGYDPLTSKLQTAFSLSDQLEFFKEYKNKINAAVGEERSVAIISESIYIVFVGSNDIANTYFSTPLQIPHYDVPAYTDLLLESASAFIQDLYTLGARQIGIFNVPPIGCVPSQRTEHGGIKRECYEAENQAAILFNSKLSTGLQLLRKTLPEAQLIYIDLYNPLLSMIQNPAQHGFEVVDRGCCGTGLIEAGPLCNEASPGTCSDASKYLFWDAYHPTETGYSLLTTMIAKSISF